MKPAEYPQPRCKDAVWSPEGIAYICELPDLHPGPHASYSVTPTVAARDTWEESNQGWEQQVGTSDIIVGEDPA